MFSGTRLAADASVVKLTALYLFFSASVSPLLSLAGILPARADLDAMFADFPGSLEGQAPRVAGPVALPLQTALHDYKGVIHCHSHFSHDSSGTESRIVQAANRAKLDFLVMTDHYTDRAVTGAIRGFRGKTLFLAGAEISGSFGKGSLLALGLMHPLSRSGGSAAEIAREIHRQGALVFLGHLEKWKDIEGVPFDGFEIYNMHAATTQANVETLAMKAFFFTPRKTIRSLARLWPENMELWERWLERRPVPIIAGNDAHDNVKAFSMWGGRPGAYEQSFRAVTTHVWAKSLDSAEILAALREGRSYVSFDAFGDATGFSVVPIQAAVGMKWRVSLPRAAHLIVRQGGRIILEGKGRNFEFSDDAPRRQAYRIEAYLSRKPWIIAGSYNYFPNKPVDSAIGDRPRPDPAKNHLP